MEDGGGGGGGRSLGGGGARKDGFFEGGCTSGLVGSMFVGSLSQCCQDGSHDLLDEPGAWR